MRMLLLMGSIVSQKRLPRNAALREELLDQGWHEPFLNYGMEHRVRHFLRGIKDKRRVLAGSATPFALRFRFSFCHIS